MYCTCRDLLIPGQGLVGATSAIRFPSPATASMTMICPPLTHRIWMNHLLSAGHILGPGRGPWDHLLLHRDVCLIAHCCPLGPRRVLGAQLGLSKCLLGEGRPRWEQEPRDPFTPWCWALSGPPSCHPGRPSWSECVGALQRSLCPLLTGHLHTR